MDRKAILITVVAFLAGGGIAAAALKLTAPTLAAAKDGGATTQEDEDDEESAANARLVESLQECNRRLSNAGQKPVEAPSAVASAPRFGRGGDGGRGGRNAGGPTDWDKLAQQGAVPYSIPCIRDTPFKLSDRQVDRLGLAPHDAQIVNDAYVKSNQRVTQQLTPICEAVLGKDLATRLGPQACMTSVIDGARRADPQKMKEALVRVDEVNGGKRPAPTGNVEPIEALMLVLSNEQKSFEADLTAQLGPDDAKRIAQSRGMCQDRGMVRASQGDAP